MRTRQDAETPIVSDAGGLSGVTSVIKAQLAEIGLKHISVSAQGNCFFLAASYGLFNKTSKFIEVRRAGAKYAEDHFEELSSQVTEGECLETIVNLRKMNEPIDDLGITAVSLAYGRPVEIWQRAPDGAGIETHQTRGVANNSILMWYNGIRLGTNGQGNHYDALEITNRELFSRRSEKCALTLERNRQLQGETANLKGTSTLSTTTTPTVNGSPRIVETYPDSFIWKH